jgi:hypothetical protein
MRGTFGLEDRLCHTGIIRHEPQRALIFAMRECLKRDDIYAAVGQRPAELA